MLFPFFTALALAAAAVFAQETTADVSQAFNTAKLVPDVLPSFHPTGLLGVVYTDSAGKTIDVTPGVKLDVQVTTIRPQFSLTSDNATLASETFVLVMIDPDAPTPHNRSLAQVRHLVAGGLRLNGSVANGALLVNGTPAVSDYISPSPPPSSDPHRYTQLLFVQPDGFDASVAQFVNASTPILGFDVSTFAQELGLGSPVAGNFFAAGPASNSSANSSSTSSSGGAAATQTQPSSALVRASSGSMAVGFIVALATVLLA